MTKLRGVFLRLPVANAPNLEGDVEIMTCLKLSGRKIKKMTVMDCSSNSVRCLHARSLPHYFYYYFWNCGA